jgi:hypothetical protein
MLTFTLFSSLNEDFKISWAQRSKSWEENSFLDEAHELRKTTTVKSLNIKNSKETGRDLLG